MLKGLWSTVMVDEAYRAHKEMTVQMEHTPCKDPLKDEAAMLVSCIFPT